MKVLYSRETSIIITGYKGYIAKKLIEKIEVSDWCESNIENILEPCTIVHLAAKADIKDGSVNLLKNNINVDLHILEQCCANSHRIIYISTNNVYPLKLNCDEEDGQPPKDSYSLSKFVGEHFLKVLPINQYIVLRLADVFGSKQKHGNFFKAIEYSLYHNQPFKLINRGDKLRSYIYIDELVNILEYSFGIDEFDGRTYNICHNEPLSLYDILTIAFNSVHVNTKSSYDYRTMKQSAFFDYSYKFTIQEALNEYLLEIRD
ncbi:NAD-dependent epimerase/dehydratase family protein [Vibrio aestuarianus]|uniref:NAD-dependent epimerase/dehydratase family protein n=1 Tax=Vibrio aestuarianus TaxID=28171 RepID=UPI00237CFBD3|nr:SDR family oxidoreductase [Vibrio aestuarianus]MDE1330742.1 SDR family oxidoreductase [Vibrio aestuarianus]